jgi:hypothetical protein
MSLSFELSGKLKSFIETNVPHCPRIDRSCDVDSRLYKSFGTVLYMTCDIKTQEQTEMDGEP